MPDKPSEPVVFPESDLTHDFLVRQSCVGSVALGTNDGLALLVRRPCDRGLYRNATAVSPGLPEYRSQRAPPSRASLS